jgi:two-component system OmpR family sensor kinase
MSPPRPPALREPPILLQILVLLFGGLIVAQLVTLLLTLVLPPAPPAKHSLSEIAAALQGHMPAGSTPLVQAMRKAPPEMTGPGWFTSDTFRHALAQQVGAREADVRLAFYAPLPIEGITAPPPHVRATVASFLPISLMLFDQPGPPPGGGMPGMGFPGGRTSNDGFPRDEQAGRFRGAYRGQQPGRDDLPASRDVIRGDQRAPDGPPSPSDLERQPAAVRLPQASRREPMIAPLPTPLPAPIAIEPQRVTKAGIVAAAAPNDDGLAAPSPRHEIAPAPRGLPVTVPTLIPAPSSVAVPAPSRAPVTERQIPRRTVSTALPIAPRAGLFGLAPLPFVEGDFVAAMRHPDGRWSVVQPAPEAFPTAWQRRVILWFLIAFAIVAPLGWLFARRIVRPLARFTEAAEQLGRDPSAALVALEGPAEIGRAANAFNVMQSRLRSFVDDRTAMVGAISHDLRTPLTRLRFRIEEVDDDDVRHDMTSEVEEMEAMITSDLAFIRDASTPGVRERLDLALLVEDAADDAVLVGGNVTVEKVVPAPVEVDVLGLRRLLANLIENAIKYGQSARIRLSVEDDAAVAAIIDEGPGLPAMELERAFEPFYRTPDAVNSGKQGSGLGLAVCRSIARAHGGDVRLLRSDDGFAAELRLPLSYGARYAA